jgi:hypothetical protein
VKAKCRPFPFFECIFFHDWTERTRKTLIGIKTLENREIPLATDDEDGPLIPAEELVIHPG